jgi:hypothetical protein
MSKKIKISKKARENPCKSKTKECGKCRIPNPMNTDTKARTQLGLSITNSPQWQNSIMNRFGKTKGKKKIRCEYNRVKKIAEKDYGIKVKQKLTFKV